MNRKAYSKRWGKVKQNLRSGRENVPQSESLGKLHSFTVEVVSGNGNV